LRAASFQPLPTAEVQLKPDNILKSDDRSCIATGKAAYRPYDRYGVPNETMDWIPLSGDANEGYESFMLTMKPGGQSTPHRHTGREEFLILDGSITDCDGVTFTSGDYVKYRPGSTHYSHSKEGCTMLVILTGQNCMLDSGGK
jgi:mannose-6-phosphate isomerase-like protein (cupin superfamily)